jgi:hypothetical protein
MLTEKRNRKGTVYHEENGEIVAKSCAKCNEIKTLNDYTKHKAGLGGRESCSFVDECFENKRKEAI